MRFDEDTLGFSGPPGDDILNKLLIKVQALTQASAPTDSTPVDAPALNAPAIQVLPDNSPPSSPLFTEDSSGSIQVVAEDSLISTGPTFGINNRYPERLRTPNVRLYDLDVILNTNDLNACHVETLEPQGDNITIHEALAHAAWTAAMEEELEAIRRTNTWTLVRLPPGKKAISCKWVFKAKPILGGTSKARLKARLVARGFEQRYGINFEETFAPVVWWSTVRFLTSIAAAFGWDIHHMDVITAFLNGKLLEEVYMLQPPGFTVPGFEDFVCKLNNSLYGLKQSPRAWYQAIDNFLCQNN